MLTTKYRIATVLEEVDFKLKTVQLPGYIEMIKALQKIQIRCEVMKESCPGDVSESLRHEMSLMKIELQAILQRTKVT